LYYIRLSPSNRGVVKSGLIGIGLGVVLTIVGYQISGVFDAPYFYIFYGTFLWGIVSLIRGIVGFVIYKSKSNNKYNG